MVFEHEGDGSRFHRGLGNRPRDVTYPNVELPGVVAHVPQRAVAGREAAAALLPHAHVVAVDGQRGLAVDAVEVHVDILVVDAQLLKISVRESRLAV